MEGIFAQLEREVQEKMHRGDIAGAIESFEIFIELVGDAEMPEDIKLRLGILQRQIALEELTDFRGRVVRHQHRAPLFRLEQ